MPERDFYNGHPGDGGAGLPGDRWRPLQTEELSEKELDGLIETYEEKGEHGAMEWYFLDQEGTRRRRRIPVFRMDPEKYPNQYHQELEAPQVIGGSFELLHRFPRGKKGRKNLRRRKQRRFGYQHGEDGRDSIWHVNEYPPISTEQSDLIEPGVYGTAGPSPKEENLNHGNDITKFYSANGLVRRGQPLLYHFPLNEVARKLEQLKKEQER